MIPCTWRILSHNVERSSTLYSRRLPSTAMNDKNFLTGRSQSCTMYGVCAIRIADLNLLSTAVRLSYETQIAPGIKVANQRDPNQFHFPSLVEITGCADLEIVALSLRGSWQSRTDDDDVQFPPLTIPQLPSLFLPTFALLYGQAFCFNQLLSGRYFLSSYESSREIAK
jgi:hypothetical protein